jgi:hypothetical protein
MEIRITIMKNSMEFSQKEKLKIEQHVTLLGTFPKEMKSTYLHNDAYCRINHNS